MRSAARITSSGRKSSTGVFFARIWRLIDAWIRLRCAVEDLDDLGVTVLAVERVEVHDRPVELVVDVDGGDRDELQSLVVDADQLLGDHLAQGLVESSGAGVPVAARRGASAAHGVDATGGPEPSTGVT